MTKNEADNSQKGAPVGQVPEDTVPRSRYEAVLRELDEAKAVHKAWQDRLAPELDRLYAIEKAAAPAAPPAQEVDERAAFEKSMRADYPLFPLETRAKPNEHEYISAGTQHMWNGFRAALGKKGST